MPYIIPPNRPNLDKAIGGVLDAMTVVNAWNPEKGIDWDDGELNYIISRLCWKLFDDEPRYKTGGRILMAMEAAKLEFYRRKMAPLEDIKILENGDL